MLSVQYLREFINERLTAAAEEIFTEFEKTIVQYEEEIELQRRLLDITWKPEIKLHRTELRQSLCSKEEEALPEQKLWKQERSSSLDQEEPEPPQIKEEEEELCSSLEGEQLVLKEETDTFMVYAAPYVERGPNEQLLSENSPESRSRDQGGSEDGDSDLPQHHDVEEEEEEEDLPEQQLWNQERISSLDQEEPEPPQIKEEEEKLCSSLEGEQLALKEETDTFMLTAAYKERDHSEPESDREQLLSYSFADTNGRDQRANKYEDSASTGTAEQKPKKRNQKELPQQHVCKEEEEVLPEQQLWNQEVQSSRDQEEPEPPQNKEEQEELCSSQEGEQHALKEKTDTFMVFAADERGHSEPESDREQLPSHSSPETESTLEKSSNNEDSELTENVESIPKKRRRTHTDVDSSPASESQSNAGTGRKSDVIKNQFRTKNTTLLRLYVLAQHVGKNLAVVICLST
ncbi:golgin subfamily A member 6-like protein 22 [Archocentrus centrarchus]|uniref:golgin subfamily A member 6-like protein 22 n=1 Tax=Archocentrus centrarchus TaxID=63155 RepID=UPI0011E9FADE|nr:golgin subfamily A member 6-like protein 22 [Archocentrus centrarchus]